MAERSNNTAEKSENVLQESSIDAKGNVQVGNNSIINTYQVVLFGGKIIIWLVPLLVIGLVLFPSNKDSQSNNSLLPSKEISTGPSETSNHERPGRPPFDSTRLANKERIPTTKPVPSGSHSSKKKISTIGIAFHEVDGPLKKVLFNAYSKAFRQQNLNLISYDANLPCEGKLICALEYDKKEINLNGPAVRIDAFLTVTLLDLKTNTILGSDQKDTTMTIRNEEDLPQGIKQWLSTIDLLEKLLSKNLI